MQENRPDTSLSRWWGLATYLFLGFFLAAPLMQIRMFKPAWSAGDEGAYLMGAHRVLTGQIPYRDFDTVVTPGSFYATALFFKLFGETFIIARIVHFLTWVVILLAFWKLMGTFQFSHEWRLVAITAVFAFGPPYWPILSPHWLELAFFLLSLLALQSALERPRPAIFFLSGTLAACSLICLQGISFFWILLAPWAILKGSRGDRLKPIGAFLAGILVPGLPVTTLLIWKVPWNMLWENLVTVPFFYYPRNSSNWPQVHLEMRRLLPTWPHTPWALTPTQWIHFCSSLISFLATCLLLTSIALAAFALIHGWVKSPRQKRKATLPLQSAIFLSAILVFPHRASLLTLAFLAAVPVLIACEFLSCQMASIKPWIRGLLAIGLGAPFLLLGIAEIAKPALSNQPLLSFPKGKIFATNRSETDSLLALQDFSKGLHAEDSVLCFYYCPAYHFLLGIDNPTSFDILIPACTTPRERAELLTFFREQPPDWIILYPPGFSSDLLGDELETAYTLIRTTSWLEFLHRNESGLGSWDKCIDGEGTTGIED